MQRSLKLLLHVPLTRLLALVKERAARTGRNPQTGAEIQIAAATIPSFKAGKGLKDQVNP